MRNLLDRLGAMRPGVAPMLSVYLDLRTQTGGDGLTTRPGASLARERLRALERAQTQAGRAFDSLRFDIRRIQRYLERGIRPSTRGAAIFACADRGLFEVVDVDVPFATSVTLRPLPDLRQLARLEAWDVHQAPAHPGEPDEPGELLAPGAPRNGWRLA